MDGQGNVYVADCGNHTVRKISPAGMVTTLAGVPGSYGYKDGPGASALFFVPMGIAVDAAGNVFVSDTMNNVIRKITPDGTVSTFAGQAGAFGMNVDGQGAKARFNYLGDLTMGPKGVLYATVKGMDGIRMITPDATVTTLAIDPASQSAFDVYDKLAVDTSGTVYLPQTEQFGTILTVTSAGVVSHVQEWQPLEGKVGSCSFTSPTGLGVASDGSLLLVGGDGFTHLIPGGTPSSVPIEVTLGLPAGAQPPLLAGSSNGLVLDPTTGACYLGCLGGVIKVTY